MAKYKKKPVIVDAEQWFKNGDHTEDFCVPIKSNKGDKKILMSEGQVVRYFRHPDASGKTICSKCEKPMHEHGWIDTSEDGYNVCPGDWIIKDSKGEFYPMEKDIFPLNYEKV